MKYIFPFLTIFLRIAYSNNQFFFINPPYTQEETANLKPLITKISGWSINLGVFSGQSGWSIQASPDLNTFNQEFNFSSQPMNAFLVNSDYLTIQTKEKSLSYIETKDNFQVDITKTDYLPSVSTSNELKFQDNLYYSCAYTTNKQSFQYPGYYYKTRGCTIFSLDQSYQEKSQNKTIEYPGFGKLYLQMKLIKTSEEQKGIPLYLSSVRVNKMKIVLKKSLQELQKSIIVFKTNKFFFKLSSIPIPFWNTGFFVGNNNDPKLPDFRFKKTDPNSIFVYLIKNKQYDQPGESGLYYYEKIMEGNQFGLIENCNKRVIITSQDFEVDVDISCDGSNYGILYQFQQMFGILLATLIGFIFFM